MTTHSDDPSHAIFNKAKWAFTTRHVPKEIVNGIRFTDSPQSGDLLLARIEWIGHQTRLHTREGRFSDLFVGDLIVATCGARFATDQFEGISQVRADGKADLLAAGGIIGHTRSRHNRMKPATRLRVLGVLTDPSGKLINISQHTIIQDSHGKPGLTIGIVGSAMNSGKTTTAAYLIHGLEKAGWRTAGIKLTGTGSFGDLHAYIDAGASVAMDFTDAGMASTYLEPIDRIIAAGHSLLAAAARHGCDTAVIELADGITQAETSLILNHPQRDQLFDAFLLVAADSLAAIGGMAWLSERGIAPVALSGLLTRAPLVVGELSQRFCIPVLTREDLAEPTVASSVINRISAVNHPSGP
mgnify:CR=1 FL=1